MDKFVKVKICYHLYHVYCVLCESCLFLDRCFNNAWKRDKETWGLGRCKCFGPKRRGVINQMFWKTSSIFLCKIPHFCYRFRLKKCISIYWYCSVSQECKKIFISK